MKTSIEPLRNAAVALFRAGIAAADPYQAVSRCLAADQGYLRILLNDETQQRTGRWLRIHLLAFGKAACPMIRAAIDRIPPAMLSGRAIAVTNHDNVKTIEGVEVIGAGHPLPDESGFAAARLCADIADKANAGELVLVLVSGGGSALIPYPCDGINLVEKIRTTDLLLASGANINQINCVRKHLSQLKGGGLARFAAPAEIHALILSDVIGDDLSSIASGPTVPDASTYAEAIAILKAKSIWQQAPDAIRHHLKRGEQGKISETPKPGDPAFARAGHTLIGSNRMSVNAVLDHAQSQGFEPVLYRENLCGEAAIAAEKLVTFAKDRATRIISRPTAIISGGESTVTIKGKGKGGRNQELALAFAIHAEKQKFAGNWTFLSGGTDGRDGPTDAAGGIVDPETITRMRAAGINPEKSLADNNSYHALKAANNLLMTGATGTNVADLQVLLIQP